MSFNETAEKVKTEKKIILSFLNLLSKKEIETISTSEIIENAHVSRSTFYSYFRSKEDLNVQSLSYILDEMTLILSEDMLFRKSVMIKLFQYIRMHNKVFLILMEHYPDFELRIKDYIRTMILNSEIPNLKKQLAEAYEISDYFALDIYVVTIESIIFSWIKDGSSETPEQLADILFISLKI